VILAMDTTHELGSLALVDGERVVEEVTLTASEGFAQQLFQAIGALLERHNLVLAELEGIAVANGPGSFTGVRTGLTAAKGLAEAVGKPLYGISNLAALASFREGSEAVAVYFDARRGDVYAMGPDGVEVVRPLEEWKASLPEGVEAIGFVSPVLAGAVGRLAAKHYAAGSRPDPAAVDANYVRSSDAELNWKVKV
jgi:tRNA threonylcarbamoyladenosine biosynthesis protein TsaB